MPLKSQSNYIMRKPHWIRISAHHGREINRIKHVLKTADLHTVCEAAICPNLTECFNNGTATFLIMGELCTRRCPFCNIAHGQPQPLDQNEPSRLAATAAKLGLRYVVITSVNRDDLPDGGAAHFSACIKELRTALPEVIIEVLVPDFRGRLERALALLTLNPPDIFNHNLETVPRLYREIRPGANYEHSLNLFKAFSQLNPEVPIKSGLMLGLGETRAEIEQVLRDLITYNCTRLTLGQYLQPSRQHLPVARFIPPEEFDELRHYAQQLGFTHIASAPLVRSSYYAELQARNNCDH